MHLYDTVLLVTLQQCGWEQSWIRAIIDQIYENGAATIELPEIRLSDCLMRPADGSIMTVVIEQRPTRNGTLVPNYEESEVAITLPEIMLGDYVIRDHLGQAMTVVVGRR
ncbi:MAG: hypothetical protein WC465_00105 [Patescibacteria group bacterium]